MMNDTEIKLEHYSRKSREELIDDMALPFLNLAERLEAARLNGMDRTEWNAVLEANMFMWRFIANYLPRMFDDKVPKRTGAMLEMIADFMTRAEAAMPDGPDAKLVATLVEMNLNMCDQILHMRTGDFEFTVEPDARAA